MGQGSMGTPNSTGWHIGTSSLAGMVNYSSHLTCRVIEALTSPIYVSSNRGDVAVTQYSLCPELTVVLWTRPLSPSHQLTGTGPSHWSNCPCPLPWPLAFSSPPLSKTNPKAERPLPGPLVSTLTL